MPSSAQYGPNSPSANAVSGLGQPWQDTGNCYASDDAKAYVSLSSGSTSELLELSGFSFAVWGTIVGIQVSVERSANSATFVKMGTVQLQTASAAPVGDNKGDATLLPLTDTVRDYGGASDDWAASLTAAEVNSSGFGIQLGAVKVTGAAPIAYVDHVEITVWTEYELFEPMIEVTTGEVSATVGAAFSQPTVDIAVTTGQSGVTASAVVETEPNDIQVTTGQATVAWNSPGWEAQDIEVTTGEASATVGAAVATEKNDIEVTTGQAGVTDANTLSAPTGLSAIALGRTLIYLQWTDTEAAETGYEIWHSANGWTFYLVDTVAADAQQFFDAELTPGTTYYYLVRAVDSAGPYYSAFASTSATTEGHMNAIFRGDAVAVAHVLSSTLGGTWIANETITVTINGKSVVHTLASTVIATIATNLAATLNASTITEFAEITWSATATAIVATSDTAGTSISFTIATDSASGTVGTVTTVTANDGPNAFSAANMDGGSLPGTSDTLTLENSDIPLRYNLDAVSDTLSAVYIEASYTGEIGLPRRNIDGTLYWEYRTRELTINTSVLKIGEGEGDGSGRLQINLGSVQSAVLVEKTGDSAEDGFHALRIRGTHASNTLQATGDCSIDIAAEGDQAAAFATVTVGGNAKVRISRRVTIGTLNIFGSAEVELDSAAALADITAINVGGSGRLTIRGDNTITALKITETGFVDDRGSGTIAALTMGPESSYTTEESTVGVGGRTITNVSLTPGQVSFQNGNKTATFSNPVDFGLGGLKDFPNADFGYEINVQVS